MTTSPAPVWWRRALLIPAAATLLVAVVAGLERMAVALPATLPSLAALHGPLAVCGFFGLVISLERAVALGGRWPLLVPASVIGALALLVAGRPSAAAALFFVASLGLGGLSLVVVRRQLALHTVVLLLGALAWGVGNAAWLFTGATSRAVWWWAAFLVVTIAGERVELSRLLPRTRRASLVFAVIIAVVFLGLAAGALALVGGGFVALALWLLRHDVARRTIKKQGLPRYAAAALLGGFVWLAVGGVLLVVDRAASSGAGLRYDAAMHAIAVGFVLSMVFAHAPIILPAVARLDVRYRPSLYLPLLLLHASLLVRVAGDLFGRDHWRQAGGVGNASALVAFAVVALAGALRARTDHLDSPGWNRAARSRSAPR